MSWFHICFSFKLEALQILKYNPGRICFVREQCGITEGRGVMGELREVGEQRDFHFPSASHWDRGPYLPANQAWPVWDWLEASGDSRLCQAGYYCLQQGF